MSRQNITKLRLLPFFSPLDSTDFETKASATDEDRIRANGLLSYARQLDSEHATQARFLAKRLTGDDLVHSLASARYMRWLRARVISQLWELAVQQSGTPTTFTLCPQGMEIAAKDLSKVDPRALVKALRADLYRAGAGKADGCITAFLDGEYNPETDMWRLHWHGLVAGSYKECIDKLRNRRKYRRPTDVHIVRKPLHDLPRPLTYLIKPFWGSRWEGDIDGQKRRRNERGRVPEPRHSELLLWLDSHGAQDMALLMGVQVVDGMLRKNTRIRNVK